MSFLSGLLDVATKAVGGLVGGDSSSPISGLIGSATNAIGDLLGDATGGKIGDKVGDVVGDLLHSDKIGDKIGDVLGGALGGETKIADFLDSKAGAIGDKIGDLFGSEDAGSIVGNILGGLSGEAGEQAAAGDVALAPRAEAVGADTIDLSQLVGQMNPAEFDGAPPEPTEMGVFDDAMASMPADLGQMIDPSAMTGGEMNIMTPEMMTA